MFQDLRGLGVRGFSVLEIRVLVVFIFFSVILVFSVVWWFSWIL